MIFLFFLLILYFHKKKKKSFNSIIPILNTLSQESLLSRKEKIFKDGILT